MTRSPTRRSRALALALAFAAALLALLALARPARAGSYVVTQCSSINPSPGQASWERTSTHYAQRTRCAAGEGLQVFHDAETTDLGRYGAWVWRAPAGTVFTSVQANASLTHRAGHHAELWAAHAGGGATQWGAEHADFRVHSVGGELTSFAAVLRCAAPGAGGDCGRAGYDSAHAYVKGVFARVEDRTPPSIELTGGTLLDAPVVRGTRTLGFEGADAGGGIRTVTVHANGAELLADARNCALAGGFATALSPCPPATAELAGIATAAAPFSLGPDNIVVACVEDLALDGTPHRACAERRLWVDNACPGSPAPAAELAAGVAARRASGTAERAEVRSDRGALVAGRVLAPGGAPLAGATVCALTRTRLDGAPVALAATAASGADGRYEIELPPGPSREVFVHHAHGDAVSARHGLSLDARAVPTLEVGPRRPRNGGRLRFRGGLPGPACAGRVVKVQARLGKRRWQVFRTDRADAACAFAARYRLRSTRADTTYRFRAYVPAQAGYPYLPGRSRVVRKRAEGGR